MPTLSIIIPTFNSARSIERCLCSIRSQTFTDYEVVIQDGVSTDNTIDLIKEFRNANAGFEIKIQQERDKGIYDAMNKGIQRANGTWLFFLGSDDELHDANVLQTMMAAGDAADCGVLYGNVKVIGNTDWAKNDSIYDGAFNLEKLLVKNICHQAMFYRAELIKKIGGYNLNYVVCADWDFNMRCWSKAKFKFVDVVVANFYAGGNSTNSRPDEHLAADVASNVIKYFKLSIYDPLVNRPAFVGFAGIQKMQESKFSMRRALKRIYKGCARRLDLLANKFRPNL